QGFENTSRRHAIKNRTDVEKQYEIGRTIGDGNFAVVKKKHCDSDLCHENFPMKIVDKSKLKGKEDMMESEILIIRSLSHPNIVSLIEVYETEAEIYLILEYVPGGDLFDAIIESVKFTEHDAAVMITDLCEALVYIHSKNIVHRDLKPENLLVQHNADKSTTLKLADFGLAKQVTKPIFTVCGTPTYVAPEILAEKGYGLEVDMWAAGVILYILLCGFPPFRSQDRDQEELFQIIQLGHYEFLSPYWDNISAAAKDLITRLLIVDPQKRYTARQVLQHPWIRTAGKTNSRNLQREVTINIERHFRAQRRKEVADDDT
ncbi:Serine/threonine-protein kinase DCLK3, partial [Phalacrocorax carbo]